MSTARWLTNTEQRDWRSFVTVCALLPERLETDLSRRHGLSLAEYDVLVHLSEAPDRRMRMSDLANAVLASRSRLSHQITRMERDGLVKRQECESDRRGWLAVLTDEGMHRLQLAAPDHVESARSNVLDQLSDEEFTELGRLCRKIGSHLHTVR